MGFRPQSSTTGKNSSAFLLPEADGHTNQFVHGLRRLEGKISRYSYSENGMNHFKEQIQSADMETASSSDWCIPLAI